MRVHARAQPRTFDGRHVERVAPAPDGQLVAHRACEALERVAEPAALRVHCFVVSLNLENNFVAC